MFAGGPLVTSDYSSCARDKRARRCSSKARQLVDCSAISNAKINSCPLGRGQQQFVHPRPEVFELFDLLEDGGAFLFFDHGPFFRGRGFLVAIGEVSVCLRRRSAASSVRSTLLGEAGWHRADFAEARTLDDGPKLVAVDQMRKNRRPPWAADQFMWLARCCRSGGKLFPAGVFLFFSGEALFYFFGKRAYARGHAVL